MNLKQQPQKTSNSYFCTWVSQFNGRSLEAQAADTPQGRDFLTEETVFGPNGMIHQYKNIREHLLFVFDDGWDVGWNLHMGRDRPQFGSLIVNTERFPSCQGTPVERLQKLNQMVKAHGWKGTGIWVCSNAQGETADKRLSLKEREAYWRERLRWSHQAGIAYWKVDWGYFERDEDFRRQLTAWAEEEAPGLIVEHAGCVPPLNGVREGTGRFLSWGQEPSHWMNVLACSHAFRSYDVTPHLSVPTTLDRIWGLLSLCRKGPQTSLINGEDELYLCAALQLSMGVMRSSLCKKPATSTADPCNLYSAMAEVDRAVAWQTCFAPAVPAGEGQVFASDEILFDVHDFSDGQWNGDLGACPIQQGAPAVVSRGCPLPQVEYLEETKPYIVASRHPNGNMAVCTLHRMTGQMDFCTPPARLSLELPSTDTRVGVFGYMDRLTLICPDITPQHRVWAQDLALDRGEDITHQVTLEPGRVIIDGKLLKALGTKANKPGDPSEPGVVIGLI